ncbi:MAG: NUDIX domain-containing protein [Ilumatobacteraceae bacterium]
MSGDPGDELVDIVDGDDEVVGTVTRSRMRRERLRHRTAFIVISSTDGRLLVHRRSEDKDVWPGRWDLAVGGVVGSGESYEQAARRELAEEVGVTDAEPHEVTVGRYADDDVDLVAHVFRIVHDGPFRFADGEVVEARWVDRPGLDALVAEAAFVPDSLALLTDEIRFPFSPPRDPQER